MNDRQRCHTVELSFFFVILRLFVVLFRTTIRWTNIHYHDRVSWLLATARYHMVGEVLPAKRSKQPMVSIALAYYIYCTVLKQVTRRSERDIYYCNIQFLKHKGGVCCSSGCLYSTFYAMYKQLGANIRQPSHIYTVSRASVRACSRSGMNQVVCNASKKLGLAGNVQSTVASWLVTASLFLYQHTQ